LFPAPAIPFLLTLAISTLIGVGLREYYEQEGKYDTFGTVRTFIFIGMLGLLLYRIPGIGPYAFLLGLAVLGQFLKVYYRDKVGQRKSPGLIGVLIAVLTYTVGPVAVRSRGSAEGDVGRRAWVDGEATIGRARIGAADDPDDRDPPTLDQCSRRDPCAGQTLDGDPGRPDPDLGAPAVAELVDIDDGPGDLDEPPLQGDGRGRRQDARRRHRRRPEVGQGGGHDPRGVVGSADLADDTHAVPGRGRGRPGRHADFDRRAAVLDHDPATARVE
jgi:hypothetical protein